MSGSHILHTWDWFFPSGSRGHEESLHWVLETLLPQHLPWEQLLEGYRRPLCLPTQYFSSGYSQAHRNCDNFPSYLNSRLLTFEAAALWSPSALSAEAESGSSAPSPVCTAQPRSSGPSSTCDLKGQKCFAREAADFTGLLLKSWGAPRSRDQWPMAGPWMTGSDRNWTLTVHICSWGSSFWSPHLQTWPVNLFYPARRKMLFLLDSTGI